MTHYGFAIAYSWRNKEHEPVSPNVAVCNWQEEQLASFVRGKATCPNCCVIRDEIESHLGGTIGATK